MNVFKHLLFNEGSIPLQDDPPSPELPRCQKSYDNEFAHLNNANVLSVQHFLVKMSKFGFLPKPGFC